MIGRILDALRRSLVEQAPERQYRPNELRREVVRTGRLHQEARQTDAAARASRRAPEEERAPREPRLASPDAPRTTERALVSALKTRSGLRQAWVLKEVLGPPVALRGPRDDGFEVERPGTR
jgi:hypothetical protein